MLSILQHLPISLLLVIATTLEVGGDASLFKCLRTQYHNLAIGYLKGSDNARISLRLSYAKTRNTSRQDQHMSVARSRSGIVVNTVQESERGDEDCTVTKEQLMHFFELKFLMADKDQDGQLNIGELCHFLRSVTQPNLRLVQSWQRYS
jgi:hypothetical protein